MATRSLGITLLLALSAACSTVAEVEGEQVPSDSIGDGFTDPAASEGERELDSSLCWQSIESQSTAGADQAAYDECMRAKGWDLED